MIAAFLLAVAASAAASQNGWVQRVENGLRTAVEVQGRAQHYSLADRMRHYHVHAVSIAFFDKNGIQWTLAYGATPKTLFQAGSISKPVSAFGILLAVAHGKLNLDESVNAELKSWKLPQNGFTANDPVTLRELLSHTAGTNVHGFDGYERGKPVPTLTQVLDGKPPANSPPIRVVATPGKQFMYSGGGYTIALQMLLDAIHEPFAAYMRQAVLAPLNMTSSTFAQPLPRAFWNQAATAYDGDGNRYPGEWHVYPEQTAAGLWTTPSDLAKFAIAVDRAYHGKPGTLLSQALARQMLSPVKDNYGLGFEVAGSGSSARFGHDGANAGFQAYFVMHESGAAQGVAIMTDSDNGMELITEILNSIGSNYGWSAYKPVQKKLYHITARAEDRILGRYAVDKHTYLVVARHNGMLSIKSPMSDWLRLYPESPNTFFILDDPFDIHFTSSGLTITPVGLTARRVK